MTRSYRDCVPMCRQTPHKGRLISMRDGSLHTRSIGIVASKIGLVGGLPFGGFASGVNCRIPGAPREGRPGRCSSAAHVDECTHLLRFSAYKSGRALGGQLSGVQKSLNIRGLNGLTSAWLVWINPVFRVAALSITMRARWTGGTRPSTLICAPVAQLDRAPAF